MEEGPCVFLYQGKFGHLQTVVSYLLHSGAPLRTLATFLCTCPRRRAFAAVLGMGGGQGEGEGLFILILPKNPGDEHVPCPQHWRQAHRRGHPEKRSANSWLPCFLQTLSNTAVLCLCFQAEQKLMVLGVEV